MGILTTMNNLLKTKGTDWPYSVISHIAQCGTKYDELEKYFSVICQWPNGSSPKNMETITIDLSPLPDGSVLFAIRYRDVPEPALTALLQQSVQTNS